MEESLPENLLAERGPNIIYGVSQIETVRLWTLTARAWFRTRTSPFGFMVDEVAVFFPSTSLLLCHYIPQ